MAKVFLEAEWRKLIMINYAVDKDLIVPYLPNKTEIDMFENSCYLSLVGFMFLNTCVRGFKIPFHINFPEVNLRFYVRYKDKMEWKRGVVFIKEIVPRPMLTLVANTLYGENYETLPMNHVWEIGEQTQTVEYRWKKEGWNSMKVNAKTSPKGIIEGGSEEFITEHFWGYTKIKDRTSEYEVEHPRWKLYDVNDYSVNVDFARTYGEQFSFLAKENPQSVFLAEGSEIKVRSGRGIY